MLSFKICLLCFTFALVLVSSTALRTVPYVSDPVEEGGSATLPGELKFAHVIFRHGDRMPLDPYPNDPWNDLKYWPNGWGELTNRGKQQHYELGKWLRKRYNSLLSTKYKSNEIYIQSTDVDRTLMSAQSNLAGLYQPVDEDIWNTDIKWQPIPVHTMLEEDDPVLSAKTPCPAYDYAFSLLQTSPELQALYERYKYLTDYLTAQSGRPVETFLDVEYLNNTLFIETLYNRKLPSWTDKVYGGEDMTFMSNFAFAINTYTRQLARLKVGPLLKDILDRFSAKAKNKLSPQRSVWIYSAHDTTIANVLNALKVFELHSPPYAACIMIEMRVDNNTPYLSVFYKNTTAEPLPKYIPGCGLSCPLNKFINLYNDVIPGNWKQECRLSTMLLSYEDANIGAATGILIGIIVVLLIASYMLMLYFRRRNYNLYSSYAQMA